jgi:type IV pilus assembly protein PilF
MLIFANNLNTSLQEFGATVARKLLSLITLCITSLVLAACVPDTQGSLQVTYPFAKEARINALNALSDLSAGNTGEAQEKLRLALQQAPKDALILEAMGYYMEKTGDIKTANRYFFTAVTVAPASGTIRNNYGAFLCRNGYSKSAIAYFLQAAAIPNYAQAAKAYANARYCAVELGDRAESAYYINLLNQPISHH